MNGARYCLTFCFVKSNISLTYAHISRRTFQETVFHFDPVLHGHFRVVSSGQKLQQKKSYVESSLRERDDCVVNKFSISLVCGGVCGLSAQAADTVMFCFWVSKFTFPNRAKNLKLDRGQRS